MRKVYLNLITHQVNSWIQNDQCFGNTLIIVLNDKFYLSSALRFKQGIQILRITNIYAAQNVHLGFHDSGFKF